MNNAPGVIAALSWEAACLPRALAQHCSGMGRERVSQAAQALIDQGATGLVSFGSAGALSGQLSSGDLILPETIVGPGGQSWSTDDSWREAIAHACPADNVFSGTLACTDQVVGTPQAKSKLRAGSDALAVDMESAVVAEMAAQAGLPCVVIRSVVDEANQSIPQPVVAACDAFGQVRIGAFLLALVKQPGLLRSLPGLGRAQKRSAASLRQAGAALARVMSGD